MDRYCDKSDFRFVYFGTPGVSGDLLHRLIEAGYQVAALVCNPDKPVGRKHLLCPCPTKAEASRCGIPVFQPEKIRLDYAFLHSIQADFYLTFSYGQIVPKGVLEIPPKGCLNLHGSLLPELRGAAPMQRAIELGLTETGVTLMEMVEKMDELGFGNCSNYGECQAVCPKGITLDFIAKMNRDYAMAKARQVAEQGK